MTKRVACLFGAVAAVTMAACDELPSGDGFCACDDEVSVRGLEENGLNLNGLNLNGLNLNGLNLNGLNLNGTLLGGAPGEYVTLVKIRFDGDAHLVASSWLSGSTLFIKTTDNITLGGAQLEGVKLKFDINEKGSKKLKTVKVTNVEPMAPGSDVMFYDLQLKIDSQLWQPLCVDEAGEPTQAILIPDVWSPTTGARTSTASGTMTFACRHAALAKCVEWGYRPWASAGGQSLHEFHQACTRLVRADYCGDGVSHTINGTQIHVLDQVGVQNLDPNANFVVEAEWGPNGAVCVNADNMRTGPQPLSCQIPACSAAFSSGGLIQSGKVVVGP